MCNINIKQEVWDYIHNPIFQKISRPNILDLGNGPGNAFFHFYHNYNEIKYIGVEEMCKQDVEMKLSLFRYYGKNDIQDYIYGQSSFDLYNYYELLINEKIIIPEKNNILNKKEFQKLFLDKVNWGKKIKDFFEENILDNEFDIIILSKVLHYQCFDQSELLIKNNCCQAIKTNGIIFISVQKNVGNNKYEYTEDDIRKLTTQFKEVDSNLHKENENKELLFYLGSKYGI